MTQQKPTLLRVNASMRKQGSISRQLTDELIQSLVASRPNTEIVTRELTQGVSLVDEEWIGANFTGDADRSAEQRAKLTESDALVGELDGGGRPPRTRR